MADIEITQDLFSHHDPLAICKEKEKDYRRKTGRVLRWLNRTYRGMRGLDGHKYVQVDDPNIKDIIACLNKDEYEVKEESEDGKVRHGDMVLASRSGMLADKQRLQNYARSNRMKDKETLLSELQKISPDVTVDPSSYTQITKPEEEEKPAPVMTADVAERAREGRGRGR
jgi:hypothetical protein